jgi:hypothetical protein
MRTQLPENFTSLPTISTFGIRTPQKAQKYDFSKLWAPKELAGLARALPRQAIAQRKRKLKMVTNHGAFLHWRPSCQKGTTAN